MEVCAVKSAANLPVASVPEPMLEAFVVSVVAEEAKAEPLTVIASASNVPSISTSPLISRLVASISPDALNITPSALPTLNMIWSFVLNLIWSVESLPTTKDVLRIDV